MLRQIVCCCTVAAMVLSLNGCGGAITPDRPPAPGPSPPTPTPGPPPPFECPTLPTPPPSPTPAVPELTAAPVLLEWGDAHMKAEALLDQMTQCEKGIIMQGYGWPTRDGPTKGYYIGGTPAVPRLGIPALKMNDAAGGFRTLWKELVGSVTSWPSLLAMAATWDADVVREFGAALGKEFRGKGANGILGPSVNVHRVARNGRNFEYISGEDPYLGSVLVPAYIQGIHSQGILAVVKHYVLNSQETNREHYSADADDKTLWELYYPPFEAAVDAGVDAVMCGYNKVDGDYACSSGKHLGRLKKDMGFQGFVQSDWWASHDTTVAEGLDQEMPGSGGDWLKYFNQSQLHEADEAKVNASAKRILAVMYRHGLVNSTEPSCEPPNCHDLVLKTVVTSEEHRKLARRSARDSIVLLENKVTKDRNGKSRITLPLSFPKGAKIAIVGKAANEPAYSPISTTNNKGDWKRGDYYSGGGSGHVVAGKKLVTPLAGLEARAKEAGLMVVASANDDVDLAKAAAKGAEVVILVLGTTCGESVDRANLALDGPTATLTAELSSVAPVIVLAQVPGAVVLPFREDVAAMALLFLGGEQTGNAWADVVFGDVAPSGRLPIMLPETEEDTIEPDEKMVIDYNEGMATSYRNEKMKAAYPFGFGLTYTEFDFASPEVQRCQAGYCVSVTVKNLGKRAARAVPQLYLEFPAVAEHPSPLLKGFQKTAELQPDSEVQVTFVLVPKDLSYYDAKAEKWVQADTWTAHIGSSSKDILQKVCFGESCPTTTAESAAAAHAI